MSIEEVVAAVRASSLAEVAWLDRTPAVQVRGAVVLAREETPVLAFTYADEAVARDLSGAGSAVLTLSEPRSTGAAFRPLELRGRTRLVEDPTGAVFTEELLDQELRRFPPSRLLADSPLLRREHWWYLPRLLVEVDVDSVAPIVARSTRDDHLLVVRNGERVDVHLARLAGPVPGSSDTLTLETDRPAATGPAVLFGQDASFPDLERWAQWRYRGTWDGAGFRVQEAPARTGLAPTPGLLQRWRRQRDLERRCRRAIPA